jgi:acetolactate synthase-1/2/3 large subunit
MTIQELGTIMQYNVGVKIILLNNHFLGMVRQWQEMFFNERYSETQIKNPDFVKIGQAYNIPSRQVNEREDLDEAIAEMLAHEGSYLLEVIVETKGMVYPMVPAGKSITEIMLGNGK